MLESFIKKFIWLSFVILLFLTISCSYIQKRELVQKREQWSSQKINNYRYTINLMAFSPNAGKDVLIEVHDGKQVSLTCEKCQQNPSDMFEKVDTIEKIFELIEKQIEKGEDNLEIKYDDKLGYPLEFGGSSKKDVTDSLWKYRISNFEVIK